LHAFVNALPFFPKIPWLVVTHMKVSGLANILQLRSQARCWLADKVILCPKLMPHCPLPDAGH
jgi:hypothetical protein